jgi:drug/metabolite transporter (DMT)-like permease
MNDELIPKPRRAKMSTRKILNIDFLSKKAPVNINYPRSYFSKSLYMICCSILFNTFTLLILKILFHSHHKFADSNNTVNFFIGLFQILISLTFLKIDKIDLSLRKHFNQRETDYLLIRSILGFLFNHFTICAMRNMRMVSAITIIFLSPVFTTFIIMSKHRETFKRNDKISICMCVSVIVIYLLRDKDNNDDDYISDNMKGIIYSVIAAVLNSVNNVIDRKINNEFHSYVVTFVIGVYTVILAPIFMFFNSDEFIINLTIFSLYFILGMSWFFGFYFNYKSIDLNSLLINSHLHYISIGLVYFFSFFVLNENFGFFDIFISLLIIVINFFAKIRMEECEQDDNL